MFYISNSKTPIITDDLRYYSFVNVIALLIY